MRSHPAEGMRMASSSGTADDVHLLRFTEHRISTQGGCGLEAEDRVGPDQSHGVHAGQVAVPRFQGFPFVSRRIHAEAHAMQGGIPVKRHGERALPSQMELDGG